MSFGKRQLVIASLVVALGAAVYLNWQFSDADKIIEANSDVSAAESSEKQLGQTTYVNTELSSSIKKEESSKASSSEKKSVMTNAEKDTGFFSEQRAKREKGNEQALEVLTDMISTGEEDKAKQDEAAKSAEKLSDIIKKQTDLENEIRIKGFEDAFVTINNDNCSVSVYGKELDETSAIMIKDMVNRQTGIGFDSITVTQARKDGK